MKPEPREIIANALSDKLMQTRRRCQSHADFVIAALKAAGFAIVLDEAQLLEKGAEAGVKLI